MLELSETQTSLLIALRRASDAPLPLKGAALASTLRGLRRRGLAAPDGASWRLTDAGRAAADAAVGARQPRAGTKLARITELITTDDGASIDELSDALGWQAHTVRAALTRLRQRGLNIERVKHGDGASRYRASERSPHA